VRALDKTAARLHVGLVDATPVLRALGPAGFLPDDYHLAADGHAYLAALMAAPVRAGVRGGAVHRRVRAPVRTPRAAAM